MKPPRETRVAGHFGELMQGRLGPDGPVCLVTLPCPRPVVRARLMPGRGLSLHDPRGAPVSPERARRFLGALGLRLAGRVILRTDEPGLGAGVSTAMLVAIARLAGYAGPPAVLARACVASEGASDPLMFSRPERLLWASRIGTTLATLPALPALDILGGFFGPAERTDPADDRFADVSDLAADWSRPGLDAGAAAALASESARRSLALRGPANDPTAHLARQSGALGWCLAHTGAARALIFAPGAIPAGAADRMRAAGLRGVRRFLVGWPR